MIRTSDRIANETTLRDIIRRVKAAHRDPSHQPGPSSSCPQCDELDEQLSIDAGLEDPPETVIDGEVLP